VANKNVKIYERVKVHEKWTDRPVSIPKLKADGTLYLKDDRGGKFHISWYEGKNKKWHPKTRATFSDALRVKADKEWFVQNQTHLSERHSRRSHIHAQGPQRPFLSMSSSAP
jgi:hypothetical protein